MSQHHSAAWRLSLFPFQFSASSSPLGRSPSICFTSSDQSISPAKVANIKLVMPDGHNPQELKLEPLLDLTDPDRKALRTVAKKSQTHTSVGTILGLGLGLFLAFRFRRSRIQKLTAPRAQEWPIHVDRSTGESEPAG